MKISINTETEEIAELRATVAIIEDAIKRREDGEEEGESYDYDSETQEEGEVSSYEEPQPQVEQPKFQERKIEQPIVQERRIEPPVPEKKIEIPERKVTPPPTVDMSALSKSTYGERMEKRDISGNYQPAQKTPVQQQRTISQSSQPQQNNKGVVRTIVQTLKDRNRGGPIQMIDIVKMARDKRIGEDETRKLVQELQRESSI